jgi:hypothetical protein
MRTPRGFFIEAHTPAVLRALRAALRSPATVAVPGSAGITVGAIGLGAAALASTEAFRPYWLEVWLVAAMAGAGAGALVLAEQSSGKRAWPLGVAVLKFFARLLPSLFAGAVLTVVLWRAGIVHAIPGMWLLLYGCALIHASTIASRGLAILGVLFVALALVAFGLPEPQQLAILGVGFGELHILHGIVTVRTSAA